MLKWCSYCVKFLGETPPYENLAITHGLCPACRQNLGTLTEQDLEASRKLEAMLDRLMTAILSGDHKTAKHTIKNALAHNLRPIDILMGLVAPLLYRIGEDWRKGYITVAEEHRFTSCCQQIFEHLGKDVTLSTLSDTAKADRAEVLIINAPDNRHTLAIRILAAWFAVKGIPARVIDPIPPIDDFIAQIGESRLHLILISMALAEQCPAVVGLVERITALPGTHHPRILVGGYAVKMNLVPPIPGADLVSDINSLELSLGIEHLGLSSGTTA
jgi:methanogenic corrinoid protein MtbC1